MKIFGYTSHGGPEVTSFLDVPEPAPGPGEVLVEMLATAVNPGDLATRRGSNTMPVTFPMAMGREAAGRVLSVGDDVTGLAVGDVVFGSSATGHGSFGEQALLDASATAVVPPGLDVVHAACLPVAYGTALDVLDHLGLHRGQTLVVIGAGGGVGLAITALARTRGIRILGVASARKHDIVTQEGAEHIESGEGWVERVCALADAPDAVFDLVGGDTLDEGSVLVDGARLISVADPARARGHGGDGITRRRTREVYGAVAEILASGEAEVVVSRVFAFEQAADAVAIVEDGHAEGKIVVTRAS